MALKIVKAYELQQYIDTDLFKQGDLELKNILPPRAKNAIIKFNKTYGEYWGELKCISDVVKLIKKSGNINELLKIKGLGKLSYMQIMSHVQPFL